MEYNFFLVFKRIVRHFASLFVWFLLRKYFHLFFFLIQYSFNSSFKISHLRQHLLVIYGLYGEVSFKFFKLRKNLALVQSQRLEY